MRPICLLLLFFLSGGTIFTGAQDTLLLFHPTVSNLEVIENLIQEELLNLEGYHVLGVYHTGECYNYDSTRMKLKEMANNRYSILEIGGKLSPDLIFGANECTQDFSWLFNHSRGAMFMGGPDIPPEVYNEEVHLLTRVTDPFRHYLELSFLFHLLGGTQDPGWRPFMETDSLYLVTGICLGMQTLNTATGGTLIQDIPTEVYGTWTAEDILRMPPDRVHRNYADMLNRECDEPTSYHFHRIILKQGSFLQQLLQNGQDPCPLVLSSHHQAVEVPGNNLVVSATSMDGKIAEALEHTEYPHVIGVQFHPEQPGLFDPLIVHLDSCRSQINFREVIEGTGSYEFHRIYWERLGEILQEIRRN
jgi:putative glutamine amidotransferase